MRLFLIALLCLAPLSAHAQEKDSAKTVKKDAPAEKAMSEEKPAAEKAKEDVKPEEDSADEPADKAESQEESSAVPAEAKPKVDWVSVESTGTLASGKAGGLEKTLWKGQKRSEIEDRLQKLPTQFSLRSALSLQRRLLLSKGDTSLLIDDIGPLRGKDMLIQRISKLMDMGLYDDAWELYTQKAENPYDVSIAQMGMLLLVMKNDLATACLEEKVFSARYPKDRFFNTLDKACAQTMGLNATPKFEDSAVLDDVYNRAGYSVSAATPQVLARMNALERALVLANGKIRYDGLTPQILSSTPSTLLSFYLMDKALPESAKAMIKAETDKRGMTWYLAAVAKDDIYKRAKDLNKDPEDQWPVLESALTAKANPADLMAFTDMLGNAKPANLSTETLIKVLGGLLASQKALPEFWLDAAQKAAPEKPIIYIYLQAFKSLTPTPAATVEAEDLAKAMQFLKPEDKDQILAIIETLDKDGESVKNSLQAYEKQSGLTSEGDYVMPSETVNDLSDTATEEKHIGITVMAVLNSLAGRLDNMYSETVRKALKSMLNVGLIEDAKLIGSESVASVLNKY